MKIALSADWHYTDKTPSSRKDDYSWALHDKISQIFAIAKKEKAEVLLQSGDLTDSPFLSYLTYIKLSLLLKKHMGIPIITVYGQHDLRYRNKGNTPLDALASHGLFSIATEEPYSRFPNVYIYGCSFGEQHPKIQDPSKFNILILHQLIVSSQEKEWEKGEVLHSDLLENSEYDLIVSGDNHKPFIIGTDTENPRFLINCGSLMRSTIDQVEHQPFFVIFDTETRMYKKHFLKIKPWQEVFDLEKKVKEEERNESLEAFVEILKNQEDIGLDFLSNVKSYLHENKIPGEVADIVNECLVE